jgi:hypothetical protein
MREHQDGLFHTPCGKCNQDIAFAYRELDTLNMVGHSSPEEVYVGYYVKGADLCPKCYHNEAKEKLVEAKDVN